MLRMLQQHSQDTSLNQAHTMALGHGPYASQLGAYESHLGDDPALAVGLESTKMMTGATANEPTGWSTSIVNGLRDNAGLISSAALPYAPQIIGAGGKMMKAGLQAVGRAAAAPGTVGGNAAAVAPVIAGIVAQQMLKRKDDKA